jgi:predicted Zn-dependent protease
MSHSPHRQRLAAALAGLGCVAWLALPAPVFAQQDVQDQLPELGSAGSATLSIEDEYRLGRMVMRSVRESGALIEDPETTEYIQSLGLRLSSLAHDGNRDFTFFVIGDRAINAFALPGGFIGVHSGLVLETATESELAGVLAHEVAHVTQRHIARGIEARSRTNLVSTAAMLAAILLGAAAGGGSDVTMGAISAAQGLAAQAQINYTRDNEYEADRVGIGILGGAGYDPIAMARFFETMARRTQLGPDQMPELLRTHPVSSNRMAEARARAAQMPPGSNGDQVTYALVKERLRVLGTKAGEDPRSHYAGVDPDSPDTSIAQVYGIAVAATRAGVPQDAVRLLERLRAAQPEVLLFHTALGEAQLAAGDTRAALDTLERARELAPRNVPVTVRYGEALLRASRPKRAHEVLLDLFNNVPPTPEQVRLTALAANSAGDVADAYSYMAEYHVMAGDLPLAINQLELALSVPNISAVQRARFGARLNELRQNLPRERPRLQKSNEPPPGRGVATAQSAAHW